MTLLFQDYLLRIALFFILISPAHADFDQKLVNDALKMAAPAYKLANQEVAPAVQAVNFLAHELALESDPVKAKNRADTILAIISRGEGVGGIRGSKHRRPYATAAERELILNALRQAAGYLGKEESLQKILPLSSAELASHGAAVQGMLQALEESQLHKQQYNASLSPKISALRQAEMQQDQAQGIDPQNYQTLVNKIVQAGQEVWPQITNILTTTVIPQKAQVLADAIKANLKGEKGTNGINFKNFMNNPGNYDVFLKALICTEKYRLFETEQPTLRTTDPTFLDYKDTNQDPESEAVLLALVSAIHNYLLNPQATVEDLIRLYRYQKNDRTLKPDVKKAAKTLIDNQQIKQIITQSLLDKIKEVNLNIYQVQKIAIDQKAMQQKLVFVEMPLFDFTLPGGSIQKTKRQFVRYLRSRADGECGYYSLRLAEGRLKYINQIIDNLGEEDIYAWAISITGVGREHYLHYSKQPSPPSHEIQALIAGIKQVDDAYEAELKAQNIPEVVTDDQPDIRDKKKAIKDDFEKRKDPLYVKLTQVAQYPVGDLAKKITEEIYKITTQGGGIRGWYTSTATDDWREQPLQPDFITVILNNYEIYAWVPVNVLGLRKPIIQDGHHALVVYTTPRKILPASQPRRIHLYNSTGRVHYDKWVEDDNYADLAQALRHQQKNTLGNTR